MILHIFRVANPVMGAWDIHALGTRTREPSYRTGFVAQFPFRVRVLAIFPKES